MKVTSYRKTVEGSGNTMDFEVRLTWSKSSRLRKTTKARKLKLQKYFKYFTYPRKMTVTFGNRLRIDVTQRFNKRDSFD